MVENTLRVLDVANAPDIPVAAGARRPLRGPAHSASHVHGEGGLGSLELPPSDRTARAISSIELMHTLIRESPQPVTLVALAPQTNLALLLRRYPDLAGNIARIVFMGGSASAGNATSVAEFNVWHDPEAAAIVLDSDIPLLMYGLDVFNRVAIAEPVASALRGGDSARGRVVGSLLGSRVTLAPGRTPEYTGLIGDAGAVCALVDPGGLRTELRPVRIELDGSARGQTLVDLRGRPGADTAHGLAGAWNTAEVALDVDAPRYARLFLETLGLG